MLDTMLNNILNRYVPGPEKYNELLILTQILFSDKYKKVIYFFKYSHIRNISVFTNKLKTYTKKNSQTQNNNFVLFHVGFELTTLGASFIIYWSTLQIIAEKAHVLLQSPIRLYNDINPK